MVESLDVAQREERIRKIKSLKAKANLKRDAMTKVADAFTDFFGGPHFLLLNLALFFGWIIINSEIVPGLPSFDPYPFILLTTAVSLEAIVLAIFVLISQNKQTQVADLREEVELQISIIMQEQNTKILKMLEELHQYFKLSKTNDRELRHMEKRVNPEKMLQDLEDEIKTQR